MGLINFPEVRIKEYKQGYCVEVLKKKWYGKKYWVHIISWYGFKHEPFYYKDYNSALDAAKLYFGWHINDNYNCKK